MIKINCKCRGLLCSANRNYKEQVYCLRPLQPSPARRGPPAPNYFVLLFLKRFPKIQKNLFKIINFGNQTVPKDPGPPVKITHLLFS